MEFFYPRRVCAGSAVLSRRSASKDLLFRRAVMMEKRIAERGMETEGSADVDGDTSSVSFADSFSSRRSQDEGEAAASQAFSLRRRRYALCLLLEEKVARRAG